MEHEYVDISFTVLPKDRPHPDAQLFKNLVTGETTWCLPDAEWEAQQAKLAQEKQSPPDPQPELDTERHRPEPPPGIKVVIKKTSKK